MSPAMELQVEKREILGSKVSRLRREGKLPAVIFGQGKPSIPVVVDLLNFTKVYQEVGESQVIDLRLEGGGSRKVLLTEIQQDPVTDRFLHANFHEVILTEKITATVPIEILGEAPVGPFWMKLRLSVCRPTCLRRFKSMFLV